MQTRVPPPGATHPPGPDLDSALHALGYEAFRPWQRDAIETLLRETRALLVAPTGGGKSLAYQLPATILPGTTLVLSPLISLMQDQVEALAARGVAATYLASTLAGGEIRRRMGALGRGEIDIVYAAPERLAAPGFRALLRDIECGLVAVDEAHCISEWGHDFRPEYLEIGAFLRELPKARILACTATATPFVRDEIVARLGLPEDTPQLLHGFARPNLSLRAADARSRRERERRVDAALAEALGGPRAGRGAAIVYTPTRRAAEEEGRRLADAGFRAAAYHAGLDASVRDRVQGAFASGDLEVVAATNAFGMGIDRADVRAVVHLAPPASVEAYYQEVGRAGRDGAPALGLLLVSPGDMARRRHLIESDTEGRAPDPDVVRHKWGLFLELMRYAEGGSCRHDTILRYFADEEETLAGCGRCDVCSELGPTGADESDPTSEETALIVRKALSAVARLRGRFGLMMAVGLLRGVSDERLERAGLDRTPTFGALSEHLEDWLQALLRRCVTAGWVDFEGGERPVVVLTAEGAAVMRAERPARLLLPPRTRAGPATGGFGARTRSAGGGGGRTGADEDLDAADRALFEALRRHRLEVARTRGVPPYVVASDRALRDIARLRPRSLPELELAHGIGPAKVAKYGAGFLAVVEKLQNHSSDADSPR